MRSMPRSSACASFIARVVTRVRVSQPQLSAQTFAARGSTTTDLQTLSRRFLPPLSVGIVITALLFLLMQTLIDNQQPRLDEQPLGARLTFVPLLEDTPVTVKPEAPKPPEEIAPPPATPRAPIGPDPHMTPGVPISPPPPKVRPDVGIADGGILPIVTVAPEYPRRMAARGIEGWVLLAFSVDHLGRVMNPRVVEAQPASGFNQAALNAIERFKFKPRVVNGTATAVHGVYQRITFQLGES